jgi:hypothetical protein
VEKKHTLMLKAAGIWLLFIPVAIANGALREKVLAPLLGQQAALPISGLTLSAAIFLLTLMLIPLLGAAGQHAWRTVGWLWVGLTLAFEFVFGHYVMNVPWGKLLEVLNVSRGNLWLLVLAVTGLSPYLAARMRGLAS